jgi:epoxide hydrolase
VFSVSIAIVPFLATVDPSQIDDLKIRLANARLPEAENAADWSQGIPLAYVRELLDYWQNGYDMTNMVRQLNIWPQFLADIEGLPIHFLHVKSERADAVPLIMTHGWPGSVLEFMDVIGPLTAPEDPAQPAFHLVIPSLPGYAFSGKPSQSGWGIEKTADAWDQLMRALGYPRYFAQGGDWGAAVTIAMAVQNKGACGAVHVNMAIARPPEEVMSNPTPYEAESLARLGWYRASDNGYAIIQATRPQTLGYGLTDSPVGQMAWIIEKFQGWSDCGGHPESVFTKDQLLDTVMLYWLTASAASSARLYWHSFLNQSFDDVVLPMGCSLFPKELFRPSRRWAETRFKNIQYWNELDKGGHFAAMEQPELFVKEVRRCFAGMTL